ncbi:hypothetical protein BD408DRAFT_241483 [Parasitella parasitica]|nr:hypothetical protein BD408DRAFT_241483 [Parasitella parasitica]
MCNDILVFFFTFTRLTSTWSLELLLVNSRIHPKTDLFEAPLTRAIALYIIIVLLSAATSESMI